MFLMGEGKRESLFGGSSLTLTLGRKASHSMSLFLQTRFLNFKMTMGKPHGC